MIIPIIQVRKLGLPRLSCFLGSHWSRWKPGSLSLRSTLLHTAEYAQIIFRVVSTCLPNGVAQKY